jgi:hypothetical protein
MSRDRKLLCLALVVAFLSQSVMFMGIYLNAERPAGMQKLIESARRNEYFARVFSAQLGKCEAIKNHRKAI